MSNEGIDTMLIIGHDLQTLVFQLVDAKMVPPTGF